MERTDLLLAIVRGASAVFFVTQAVQIFLYYHRYRSVALLGLTLLIIGIQFFLVTISEYFSLYPDRYDNHLFFVDAFCLPLIALFLYEVSRNRPVSNYKILIHVFPFIISFMIYSVNNSYRFLLIFSDLTIVYGVIMFFVIQYALIRSYRRSKSKELKHYFLKIMLLSWIIIVVLSFHSVILLHFSFGYLVAYDFGLMFTFILVIYFFKNNQLIHLSSSSEASLIRPHDIFQPNITPSQHPDIIPVFHASSETMQRQEAPNNPPASSTISKSGVPYATGAKEQTPTTVSSNPAPNGQMASSTNLFFEDKTRELYEIMENRQLYLRPSLSLNELSLELGTNRTYMSILLNQHLHTTFTALVNGYRLKDAKNLLETTDDSLEEIYKKTGFQSRATFWRVFVQMEGCTPKQYRVRNQK